MQELSKKEARWSFGIVMVIFIAMVMFALSGCASSGKIEENICPPTYLKQYRASDKASDRLEDALREAISDRDVYRQAHKRCIDRFNTGLSKSR